VHGGLLSSPPCLVRRFPDVYCSLETLDANTIMINLLKGVTMRDLKENYTGPLPRVLAILVFNNVPPPFFVFTLSHLPF